MRQPKTVTLSAFPRGGGVLSIPAFRRLWRAMLLSSTGDWLGLLALTALAQTLTDGSYTQAGVATATVFLLRLLPALVFGPFAGVVADRLDRRLTMVVCDVARFALVASIPFVGELWWLFTATFLMETASLFWIPAKEATVPNLVPKDRLETANQASLLAAYGSAPVAALLFAGLSLLSGVLDNAFQTLRSNPVDLALWADAITFLFSAVTIARLRAIPARVPREGPRPSVWRTLVEGWSFVARTSVIRGIVIGILGAFAAGGVVIGVARLYVRDLGAGDPGYGALFGAVFIGLAAGMSAGPRLLSTLSRRRMFGLSIAAAGCTLLVLALIPNIVVAVVLAVVIGAFTGLGWVSGYTLLGLEVDDAVRGRTFAFVQTLVRLDLIVVLAVAPLLAAAFGRHSMHFTSHTTLTYNGAALTMLLAASIAVTLGLLAYRQMDDRRGAPLFADVSAAWRGERLPGPGEPSTGFFLALEGGEGAGKSTLARQLADQLRASGHEVLLTFEPGATSIGARLRELLLDHSSAGLAPRAEALLYAADRAEHVASLVRPALERGAVVITDRYVDSSVAYQGAGRELTVDDVRRVSRFATDGLIPNLTVVLDLPPEVGLSRGGEPPDRLEAEPTAFHERVRDGFLSLARRYPQRYLVLDAALPAAEVAEAVATRLAPMLPTTPGERAEQEEKRRAAEADKRSEEEEKRRIAALRADRARYRAESKRAASEARHAAASRRRQRQVELRAHRVIEAQRAAERAEAGRLRAEEVASQEAAAAAVAESDAQAQAALEAQERELAEREAQAIADRRALAEADLGRRAAAEEGLRQAEHRARLAARKPPRAASLPWLPQPDEPQPLPPADAATVPPPEFIVLPAWSPTRDPASVDHRTEGPADHPPDHPADDPSRDPNEDPDNDRRLARAHQLAAKEARRHSRGQRAGRSADLADDIFTFFGAEPEQPTADPAAGDPEPPGGSPGP